MNITGVDEVGRGAWAGPLCVGAVKLKGFIPGLGDSKTIKPGRRRELAAIIRLRAVVSLGWTTPKEIERYGLTYAQGLALERAMFWFDTDKKKAPIILDGNHNYCLSERQVKLMVKADEFVPAVSAASIVAKVARDNLMKVLSTRHPLYGFDKHVGYGTRYHISQLKLYGPCDLHRYSYNPIKMASNFGSA